MKITRIIAAMLAMILFVLPALAEPVSEEQQEPVSEEQQKIFDGYVEELRNSDRIFTVPVGVGPVFSVILRKDSLGIVFNMITNQTVTMGLRAVSTLWEVTEMDVLLKNGRKYTIPAMVQIQSYSVGTFIILNLTLDTAKTLVKIIANKSPVAGFTVVQADGTRTDVSVEEMNKTMSAVTGKVVDVLTQAGEAVGVFWKNLSAGVGKYATEAFTIAESFATDTGEFIVNSANRAGEALGGAAESAGDFIKGILDSTRDMIHDAAEGLRLLWNGLDAN